MSDVTHPARQKSTPTAMVRLLQLNQMKRLSKIRKIDYK